MREVELAKPRAIQAFEKRFKIEADSCEDVFFIKISVSWPTFFRTAFCFINYSSLKAENLTEAQDLKISKKGIVFNGSFLFQNVWGSECLIAQGRLKTSILLGHLTVDLSDGIYLLDPVGSDVWDYD